MTRHEQLLELEQYGYTEKRTGAWSDERITTVLQSRRKSRTADMHRATSRNTAQDGARGQASGLERNIAADYLEAAVAEGGDATVNALLYMGWCLSDEEVRALATELVAVLRGQM